MPSTRRNLRKAASNGQPTSDEYKRFESLMKRLVRTPKPEAEKVKPKRA